MRFSVIMPVLNEAAVLEHALLSLTQQFAHCEYELLVVDGGSTDASVAIAERYGRVISSARGRATQMNNGAKVAQGEVLVFLHADTHLPNDAFDAIEQALAKPTIVGGAFRLRFDCDQLPYRFVASVTNLRSQFTKIFTGDQAYFIRSQSFRAVGGYPEQPLMEDLEIIARLRTIGQVVLLARHITTSARRHKQTGLLRSVLLMWYLRTRYMLGTSPTRLQQLYQDIR